MRLRRALVRAWTKGAGSGPAEACLMGLRRFFASGAPKDSRNRCRPLLGLCQVCEATAGSSPNLRTEGTSPGRAIRFARPFRYRGYAPGSRAATNPGHRRVADAPRDPGRGARRLERVALTGRGVGRKIPAAIPAVTAVCRDANTVRHAHRRGLQEFQREERRRWVIRFRARFSWSVPA